MSDDTLGTRLTLLEKIRDRYDESAWDDFVRYYRDYIYCVLRSMSVDESIAEELTQKIIVKLWKKLPEFTFEKRTGKFRTWLYTVISNEFRNKVKANKVQTKYFTSADEESTDKQQSCDPEVVQAADKEWAVYVSNLAWTTISAQMPERYVEIFDMHINGKSSEEIAETLEMNYNTVNVYKKRAKDQLLSEIKRLNEELL